MTRTRKLKYEDITLQSVSGTRGSDHRTGCCQLLPRPARRQMALLFTRFYFFLHCTRSSMCCFSLEFQKSKCLTSIPKCASSSVLHQRGQIRYEYTTVPEVTMQQLESLAISKSRVRVAQALNYERYSHKRPVV